MNHRPGSGDPDADYSSPCGDPVSNTGGAQHAHDAGPDPYGTGSGPVDRRTRFENGMLVLLPGHLILYDADGQAEQYRIPINTITSCRYGTIRRGLEVRYRINGDDNLAILLDKKRTELERLKSENIQHHEALTSSTSRDGQHAEQDRISDIGSAMGSLHEEIRGMEEDPSLQAVLRENLADTKKEVFRLPKGFESAISARDEYRMWEHVINRRIRGPERLRVETVPHNALVLVNGEAVGTTPLTTDKPLVDEAILEGRYRMEVCKEGYEHERFEIPAGLGDGNTYKRIKMSARSDPDYSADKVVEQMRTGLADGRADIAAYGVSGLVHSAGIMMYLGRDQAIITDETGHLLAGIPYGTISSAAYDKGLLGGSRAVRIRYTEPGFPNSAFDFLITGPDARERSEALADILVSRSRRAQTRCSLPHIRHPDHFVVTTSDIEDNFSRFGQYEFAVLILRLFESKGYDTPGIHYMALRRIMLVTSESRLAIRASHLHDIIGAGEVRGALDYGRAAGADKTIIVCTSGFTRQARDIQDTCLELWDGKRVRDEFLQHMVRDT